MPIQCINDTFRFNDTLLMIATHELVAGNFKHNLVYGLNDCAWNIVWDLLFDHVRVNGGALVNPNAQTHVNILYELNEHD